MHHNTPTESFVEIWLGVRNFIPKKERFHAAEQFLSVLDESGLCDVHEHTGDLSGNCSSLDMALKHYTSESDLADGEDWED